FDLEVSEKHYYVADQVLVHNSELPRRYLKRPKWREINDLRARGAPDWLPGIQCLHPDTPVTRPDGDDIVASSVTVGDALQARSGCSVHVTDAILRPMRADEKAYDVLVAGALDSVTVTEEHPLLISELHRRHKPARYTYTT